MCHDMTNCETTIKSVTNGDCGLHIGSVTLVRAPAGSQLTSAMLMCGMRLQSGPPVIWLDLNNAVYMLTSTAAH